MTDKNEDTYVVVRKDELSKSLICKICNGCFCTFCYSCLHERVKNGLEYCPSCNIAFDLFATGQTLPDHHLQTIIDHVRPHFVLDGASQASESQEILHSSPEDDASLRE